MSLVLLWLANLITSLFSSKISISDRKRRKRKQRTRSSSSSSSSGSKGEVPISKWDLKCSSRSFQHRPPLPLLPHASIRTADLPVLNNDNYIVFLIVSLFFQMTKNIGRRKRSDRVIPVATAAAVHHQAQTVAAAAVAHQVLIPQVLSFLIEFLLWRQTVDLFVQQFWQQSYYFGFVSEERKKRKRKRKVSACWPSCLDRSLGQACVCCCVPPSADTLDCV